MNLYKLSQTEVNGYDTYSDCVVAAPDENAARMMRPDTFTDFSLITEVNDYDGMPAFFDWTDKPDKVTVEFLGKAKDHMPQCVICASFHAG